VPYATTVPLTEPTLTYMSLTMVYITTMVDGSIAMMSSES